MKVSKGFLIIPFITLVGFTLRNSYFSHNSIKSKTGTTYYYKKDNAFCNNLDRQPISEENNKRFFLLTTKKCRLNGYKIDLAGKKSAYSLTKICKPKDRHIACIAARNLDIYNESDIRIVYLAKRSKRIGKPVDLRNYTFSLSMDACDSDPQCKKEREQKRRLEEQRKNQERVWRQERERNALKYWNRALNHLRNDEKDLACQSFLGAYRTGHKDALINLKYYNCENF